MPKSIKKTMPGNHDGRRKIKKMISKAIVKSKCYVCVLWEGRDNEPPLAVIDIKLLEKKVTPIAKAMGSIGKHTTAVLQACNELISWEASQSKQAQAAAEYKEQRSRDLASFDIKSI